jgi:hypothetical protein
VIIVLLGEIKIFKFISGNVFARKDECSNLFNVISNVFVVSQDFGNFESGALKSFSDVCVLLTLLILFMTFIVSFCSKSF